MKRQIGDNNLSHDLQEREKKRKASENDTDELQNSSTFKKNRTLPGTRAFRACDLCRKQKTKCFKSPDDERSCVRCLLLKKECTLGQEFFPPPSIPSQNDANGNQNTQKKLDLIYEGVNEVLKMLRSGTEGSVLNNNDIRLLLGTTNDVKNGSETPLYCERDATPKESASETPSTITKSNAELASYVDSEMIFQKPVNSFKVSPFSIVCNQLETSSIPSPILNLLNLSAVRTNVGEECVDEDILSLGLLTQTEAIELMTNFRKNYGRWVLFPRNIPTDVLIGRIRSKSPLLLTTCCCLALRYLIKAVEDIESFQKRNTYDTLTKQLSLELNKSLMNYTSYQSAQDSGGDIEFLQALVILSIYSLSLSSVASTSIANGAAERTLNLDPWFLSGFGLTSFISKTTFGTLFRSTNSHATRPFTILYDEIDTDEYQTLTTLRVFNHLTLVHLINCVFSGRACIVDEITLNYCTATLSLPSSTNFDGRMVSEIGILLIAYDYIRVNLNAPAISTINECHTSYAVARHEIRKWHRQWEYLFKQPPLQFVELCYHFCCIIVIYGHNFHRATLMTTSPKSQLSDIYNEDNVNYILDQCDQQSFAEIIGHAANLMNFITSIDSVSYFAYLSDQIHFCFYFSAILLLKFVAHGQITYPSHVLQDICNVDVIFQNINLLIEKFATIKQSEQDIVSRYEHGLKNALTSVEKI